ncbi:hypothetical protein E2C01_061582 [Portunus trituberculatus]|uniref:Uncharacterized protein n=1 Tax=Portunus trituberculatus TaxID=210409 RepID=A0A5B7HDL6_PORTR|nr:hypothetical protein [Portunus trituberculatus]
MSRSFITRRSGHFTCFWIRSTIHAWSGEARSTVKHPTEGSWKYTVTQQHSARTTLAEITERGTCEGLCTAGLV